jgi:GNAT superfamily N-acetyltransferase
MAETVFLRRLSRWQAEGQREAFADMYVAAYEEGASDAPGLPPGVPAGEYRDRQDFLRRFADYVQHPGFDMMIASEAGALVGCACGYRAGSAGDSWPGHEEFVGSGQVFTVVEMMVLPSHRRRGVATRLLQQLLTRHDAGLATVRVERANAAALAAYGAWGWTRADNSEAYETWSRSLG